jgi:hypothetical protein
MFGFSRSRPAHRRYAFIITYGRSGSTLLQKIIASAPGTHFVGENNDALAGLFASYRAALEARSGEGAFRRGKTGDPWRGAHLIDPDEYNRALVDAFVKHIIRPPSSARLVGFKEIRYFDHKADLEAYLDYIRMSFSPCTLIFNKRRATDVARSGWWKDNATDVVSEVEHFDGRVAAYAAAHPGDCVSVDYDAYIRDPSALAPLFRRLGITLEDRTILDVLGEKLNH